MRSEMKVHVAHDRRPTPSGTVRHCYRRLAVEADMRFEQFVIHGWPKANPQSEASHVYFIMRLAEAQEPPPCIRDKISFRGYRFC